MQPVVITGKGIVCAIGHDEDSVATSLMHRQSGIGEMRYLQSVHHELPVGEVKLSNAEMKQLLGIDMVVVRNMGGLTPGPSPVGEGSRAHGVDSPLSRGRGAVGEAEALLLYQGAVNLGRGIDWAIDALEYLPGCQLVVVGVGDLYDEMRTYAAGKPWGDRIRFLGRVPIAELERLTPQADVGLVMLEDMGLNYHYALPNRVGDFVAAGVPMVVSDLPEMASFVRRHGVGEVLAAPGAKALAEGIGRVLAHGPYDFASAQADMDWDKEKQKLLQVLNLQNHNS